MGGHEAEPTQPPDDEHLARLLAAAIVADLRRFLLTIRGT